MLLIVKVSLLSFVFTKVSSEYLYKSVRISEAQLSVKMVEDQQQKNRPLGTLDLPLNEKLSKLVRLSKSFVVQLSFRIVDNVDGRPIENFQQKFLRFSHSKSPEHEVFFIAKEHKKRDGYYQLEMLTDPSLKDSLPNMYVNIGLSKKISRDFVRFKSRPGKYNCELILGDGRVRDGFRWELFDAFLDVSKQTQPEELSYKPRKRDSPIFELLPDIKHKFSEAKGCSTKSLFHLTFCLVCLLPLVLLLYYWCFNILNALKHLFQTSSGGDFNFSAPLFFNTLIILFALLFVCWFSGTPIAIELQLTAVVAIPCFFAAHKMLKILAIERIKCENASEFVKASTAVIECSVEEADELIDDDCYFEEMEAFFEDEQSMGAEKHSSESSLSTT